MGGLFSRSSFCDSDQSYEPQYDYGFANRVYLRDQFELPRYLFGKDFESHDQFITVMTEDGIKMLHIYHLKKSSEDNHKYSFGRVFRDYKTGLNYHYDSNGLYRRLKSKK